LLFEAIKHANQMVETMEK